MRNTVGFLKRLEKAFLIANWYNLCSFLKRLLVFEERGFMGKVRGHCFLFTIS